MRTLPRLALASLTALAIAPAAKAADGGFYLGGGSGTATLESSFPAGDYKKDSTMWRAFAGYRFGWLPILDVAVEGGYRDFGKSSTSIGGNNTEVKMTGWDGAGLVILPILPVDLYAKVGLLNYSLDKNYGGAASNASGTRTFYGAGVGFRVWRVNVRAEYERFDVPELKRSDAYSINAYFRF